MKVKKLDHVNIRSGRFAETIAFYTEVLGMACKPPPGLSDTSRAAWIYDDNDLPIIHLGGFGGRYPGDGQLKGGQEPAFGGGSIHHVALECDDYQGMLDRLTSLDLPVYANEVPQISLRQLFVQDPNGVTLELNFR